MSQLSSVYIDLGFLSQFVRFRVSVVLSQLYAVNIEVYLQVNPAISEVHNLCSREI